jgi:hypothetical protein
MNISDVIIHLGARPESGQTVSEELKDQGINLLRLQPSQVNWHGTPVVHQPNFTLYRGSLPLFIESAICGKPILPSWDPYQELAYTGDVLPIPTPSLTVSWPFPIADEVRAGLRQVGFKDTVLRGKPGMIHNNPSKSVVIAAKDTKASEVSPAPENCMNIKSFRFLVVITRILAAFLHLHQYPAFIDEDHVEEFTKHTEFDLVGISFLFPYDCSRTYQNAPKKKGKGKATGTEDVEMDEGDTEDKGRNFKLHVNLQTDFEDFNIVYSDTAYPSGCGLFIAYNALLAKFDNKTVPSVIRQFFYGCLGSSEQEAHELFAEIQEAWGVLYKSDWGNIYSHLFFCVRLALTLQTRLCPFIVNGNYCGVFLMGAGFSLMINGITYTPASKEAVDNALKQAAPHSNALWRIFRRLGFPDDTSREDAFKACDRMFKLKSYVEVLNSGGTMAQEAILKDAAFLNFDKDRSLDINAASIALVLDFITDANKDLHLLPYMHHSMLLTQDRMEIAWSAFGNMAPSFRVPGGKQMMLNQAFRVTSTAMKKKEGTQAHRDVTKIAAAVVPLPLAIKHLKEVIQFKQVLNPFGNAIVNISNANVNKTFDGESCSKILDGLRKMCNVTVSSGSGGTKRRQDGEEGPKKKSKVSDVF